MPHPSQAPQNRPPEPSEYPYLGKDNQTEMVVYQEYILSGRLMHAVNRFAEVDANGEYKIANKLKFKDSLNELMDAATREMSTSFRLPIQRSKREIRQAVEKVLMREVMVLLNKGKDIRGLLPILNIQKSVRDAMERFGVEKGKDFDDLFTGNKN
jgi:hypothetical protein